MLLTIFLVIRITLYIYLSLSAIGEIQLRRWNNMQTKNEIDILTIKAKIQKLELELNENKHLLKFLLRS